MDFARVFGILWGCRLIVLTATLSCLLGGLAVVLTSPPRYEATTRVELQIVKPDPVTGFFVNSKNVAAYVTSQVQMIRDVQVAMRVANGLGWLDSPDLQAAYAARPPSETEDFESWVARRIIVGTSASLLDGSNILIIKYRAVSPDMARLVADNIRNAYIDASVDNTRRAADGGATFLANRAEQTKLKLAELQEKKSAFEKSSGLVLQDAKRDLDTARLESLASSVRTASTERHSGRASIASLQLAQLDSSLVAAAKTLGPNNPALTALQQRRAVLAAQVAQEQAVAGSTANATAQSARITAGKITDQMAKVIDQREKLTNLRLMQDEIDMYRKQYNEGSKQAADLRQIASVGGGGVVPIGLTEAPAKPVFPNKPLILGGALCIGLATGMFVAIFAELLGRRVRSAKDLKFLAPELSIIAIPTFRLAGARNARRAKGRKAGKRSDRLWTAKA